MLDAGCVDADFSSVARVPDGFAEPVLRIRHALHGELYVKLRDDPYRTLFGHAPITRRMPHDVVEHVLHIVAPRD